MASLAKKIKKKARKRKLAGQTTIKFNNGKLLLAHTELPSGFTYKPKFLDKKQAAAVDAWLIDNQWRFKPSPYGRRVVQFGYAYQYATRSVRELKEPIPAFLKETLLGHLHPYEAAVMTQCIINEYKAGEHISAHKDAKCFGNVIRVYSCGVPTTVVLKQKAHEPVSVDVQPNSMYILQDEARHKWTHETLANSLYPKKRRYSFTFRSVLTYT